MERQTKKRRRRIRRLIVYVCRGGGRHLVFVIEAWENKWRLCSAEGAFVLRRFLGLPNYMHEILEETAYVLFWKKIDEQGAWDGYKFAGLLF